ncbi:hypothetical protein F183_A09450 [Bryobacterales bacterium F-183]|nr:hypothetical protein F183_A09450 [Bryobacterales bacterium F-183]
MSDFQAGSAFAPAISGDYAAREAIRNSLGESFLVEASAGTGKTTELTRRIVNLLKSGLGKVENIVAVTFTNKAAGELKIRLRQKLDDERAIAESPEEITNLNHSLNQLEEAFIGTIHAFCAQILRERPVEARVDPAFEEITETEASRIFEEAFDTWFQQRLAQDSPGLRRALARLAWPDPWERMAPIEQLKLTGRKLLDWRDFATPWRRELFDRRARIDDLLRSIEDVAAIARKARNAKDAFVDSLKPLSEFRARSFEHTGSEADWDTLEALLVKLSRDMSKQNQRGSGYFGDGVTREEAITARDQLRQQLTDFQIRSDADLASLLRDEMSSLVDCYEALKRKSGKLDFLDLLLCTRQLVRDNQEVRTYLQQRHTHFFIDEFQDTDPVQAETLLLLCADDPAENDWKRITPIPGKLFAVGDPKQSIYKFRRADVLLYRGIQDRLTDRGVRHVKLSTSYRSTRPIQQFVNAAFRPVMTGDRLSGQAEYSDLEEFIPAHEGQPSVVALPVPKPYGQRNVTKGKINQNLPAATGAFVRWLLHDSGWKVRDPEAGGELVPVSSRHVCLLFRRFVNAGEDVTRPYIRALESHEIPHLLVGSRSFHRREEVETMRAALTAVEWPDDELSVFAALKGSLFAVEDALLLRFRIEVGKLRPFATLPEDLAEEFHPIRNALTLLRDLHKRRNWRPVADTVQELLEFTRAHAAFALRPAGQQVIANVYRIADLARNFEITGGLSFRGFVEELARQADRSDASEAPVVEYASDGVRLMTVHTAKGLEFPIVILADMTANLTAMEPDRYIDSDQGLCATRLLRCTPWELRENQFDELERERAEGVRIGYVAATRARDLLVVPAIGDQILPEGWLAPLNRALYPPKEQWRHNEHAPGTPKFQGRNTVLERADPHDDSPTVHPGIHDPMDGDHRVVWWDPLLLDVETPSHYGLQYEEFLRHVEPESAQGYKDYENWRELREEQLAKGVRASYQLVLPSDPLEAAQPPGKYATLRVEHASLTLPAKAEYPRGKAFGTLVHAVLRDTDLAAGTADLERWAQVHGGLLGRDQTEQNAAVEIVEAVLRHPLLERARQATALHRERPVTFRLTDGRIVEGVMDLYFEEASGKRVIVDFKSSTQRDPAANERQLRWYAYAVSHADDQDRPVEAHILRML